MTRVAAEELSFVGVLLFVVVLLLLLLVGGVTCVGIP